jgi:hypothetical protein
MNLTICGLGLSRRGIGGTAAVVAFAAISGGLTAVEAEAQMYKCADETGRVSYQQKPCEGSGSKFQVRPANEQVREPPPPTSTEVPPAPPSSPATDKAEPKPDPFAPHRPPGLRLSRGMNTQQVVEMWGLPTETKSERDWTFMHWCDARIALLVRGKLEAWDAPFDDSKKGATLYSYGDPWIRSTQRWSSDPNELKIEPFNGPLQGRGETRKWSPLRWVTTDQRGNITGWCDAAEHRAPARPPAFNPPWNAK